jgi:uncharacterized protein DUF6660
MGKSFVFWPVCTPRASLFCYLCNVKIITIILSFYILALNVLPCNDTTVDVNNSQTEVVFSLDWDHNHNASDLCPPFCSCHCCHVHTIDFGSSNFTSINPGIYSEIFAYSDSPGEELTFSLFQPPRA